MVILTRWWHSNLKLTVNFYFLHLFFVWLINLFQIVNVANFNDELQVVSWQLAFRQSVERWPPIVFLEQLLNRTHSIYHSLLQLLSIELSYTKSSHFYTLTLHRILFLYHFTECLQLLLLKIVRVCFLGLKPSHINKAVGYL